MKAVESIFETWIFRARLIAALLLIIGFSGYENFVSKIATGQHEDRPAWMGNVGIHMAFVISGAVFAVTESKGGHH